MMPVKFLLIPRTPRIKPDTSMPLAQMVSVIPSVFSSEKESTIGSARIWNIPINRVMAEETSTRSSTPLSDRRILHPSRILSRRPSFFSAVFFPMLFRTTAALITVRKKVQISITSSSFTSLTVSRKPARIGENRYRALPARETRPLARENSSLVSMSVIVARNAGSSSAENTELISTPMQI